MGFLKKIFRRKGSKKDSSLVIPNNSGESSNSSATQRKKTRKEKRKEKRALRKTSENGSFLSGNGKNSSGGGSSKRISVKHSGKKKHGNLSMGETQSYSHSPPQDRFQQQHHQSIPAGDLHNSYHTHQFEDPMQMPHMQSNNPYSNPGSSPTGIQNPRSPEEMVRKPAFLASQRSPGSRGSGGSGSVSRRHSQERSPHSYNADDDDDYTEEYKNGYDGYDQNDENNRYQHRSPTASSSSPSPSHQHQNMVQFGGQNEFNKQRVSPTKKNNMMTDYYEDDDDETNDENTNYSNSQTSPPQRHPPNSRGSGGSGGPLSPRKQQPQQQSSLLYDQVQRLEQMNPYHGSYNDSNDIIYQNNKTLQLKRLPDGQLIRTHADQDHSYPDTIPNDTSPVSASSEFDLSTDAEDNEYNHIRQTAANANLKPMLSPNSETSEDDDDMYHVHPQGRRDDGGDGGDDDGGAYPLYGQPIDSSRSKHYFSDSDHDTMNSPMGDSGMSGGGSGLRSSKSNPNTNDVEEDDGDVMRQQDHQNNNSGSNGTNGKKSRFTFDNEFEEALVKSKRKSPRPPSPTGFQKINKTNHGSTTSNSRSNMVVEDEKSQMTDNSFDSAMSPRALAIKAAQNMRAQGKLAPGYSDFDGTEDDNNKRHDPLRTSPSQESESSGKDSGATGPATGTTTDPSAGGIIREGGVIENFADFETFSNNEFDRTAKSVADPTSPVSELLAQARARRKHRQGASQSVNSEPALNASTIRQQLNIPPASNLEAKKKLQQRRQEKEKFLQLLQEGKNGLDEDSDKEKEKNESWLFDEVKGALGPRGIAADLESLGERSNRSKTSIGNRSHRSQKSHRSNRSYKSQRSSASHLRTKRSSDESIGSRHSRSSRYSIKSTKSYVSQMSQESRSVANDLIRLEMQLAMVGSNLKKGENEVKKQLELDAQRKGLKDGVSVGESSVGLASYSSRKSRKNVTIPKRSKTIVKAPPGKLGIILANRTDSKGTVVSGVRTTSVLADRISPGDRITAIDGEDVSRMTVPEITAIMARKSDFERILTVLKSPQR